MFNNSSKDDIYIGGPRRPTRKQRILKEILYIILIIVGVFGFRSCVVEPYRIPSGSMIPTLMIGDFILVNKMSYGIKVPFSDNFGAPIYLTTPSFPQRGDVIVFKFPRDPSMNYIKRVVGLPGDVIKVKDKVVFVNGVPIPHKEFDGKSIMMDMDDKFKGYRLRFFKAQLGEKNFTYQIDEDNFYKSDYEKIVVPPRKFFVMGDNRDFSSDSRFWGFVPFESVKGKAFFIWLSVIFPFSEDATRMRWGRVGLHI